MSSLTNPSSRRPKLIGLAISERSVAAAEVASADGELRVTHAATFAFPDGIGLEQTDVLGAALGEFLKRKGFSARSAVVGIPARWVLSKAKEVPPADRATVAESLRLQAEGDFSADLANLAFDYAGEPSTSEARTVLLMAVPGAQVEQAAGLAKGAGLKAIAVTPTAAALSAATARSHPDSPSDASAVVLSLVPGGVEFAAQHGAHAKALRHLGAPTAPAPLLAAELRRAAAALHADRSNGAYGANGSNGTNGSSNGANGTNGDGRRGAVLWDGAALPAPARLALGQAGLSLEDGDTSALGVTLAPGIAASAVSAAAIALALSGLATPRPQIDFLHPRLAPPREANPHRRKMMIGGAIAAVLLIVLVAYLDFTSLQRHVAALEAKIAKDAPAMKVADAEVKRVSYAEHWHAGKPMFFACLRDLTLAVPNDQQTYAVNFNLHDNMKGVISGKTSVPESVDKLRDEMNKSKRFTDAKSSFEKRDVREGGRTRTEVTFTLTFNYIPPP